jgi:hypothetical protein
MRIDDARHVAAGSQQCRGDWANGPASGHGAPATVRCALCLDDKRAILTAWASDFYAVDSKPAFRQMPGTSEPVLIDEVQAALRELDRRYCI